MATATRLMALGLILCLAAQTAQARTYFVGGDIGWSFTNVSSGLPSDYQAWADSITFMKDDVLVFNYTAGEENLYIFDTVEAWMACNFSRGFMLDNGTAGMSEWILTTEGHYEFSSAMFCHQKQKFSLYAVDPELLITQITNAVDEVVPPASSLGPGEAPLSTDDGMAPKSPAPPVKPPPSPSASASTIMTQVLMIVVACATVSVMHSF